MNEGKNWPALVFVTYGLALAFDSLLQIYSDVEKRAELHAVSRIPHQLAVMLLRALPQYQDQFGDARLYGTALILPPLIDRLTSDRELLVRLSGCAEELAAKFDSKANVGRLLDVYHAI